MEKEVKKNQVHIVTEINEDGTLTFRVREPLVLKLKGLSAMNKEINDRMAKENEEQYKKALEEIIHNPNSHIFYPETHIIDSQKIT